MLNLRNSVVFGTTLYLAVAACPAMCQSDALVHQEKPGVTIAQKDKVFDMVNINSASVDALEKIKGFGKKKAEAVVEYRAKNGNFKDTDELLKVKSRGLNQKWLDRVRKYLTV